jgi:hypothetical protein
MTQTERDTYPVVTTTEEAPSAWVGMVLFAGIMLLLVGTLQAIAGFVALFNDDYYLVRSADLVVNVDYTGWGVVHLVLGGVAVLAGFGVMLGQMWARLFGIILAAASAVANLAFVGANPIWCTVLIAMDVLIIWALAVHGREVKPTG